MTITVDVQEQRSRVPAALAQLDVDVELTTLPVGDYEVGDRLVERKSVDDLHQSLSQDRLWGQIAALRRDPRRAYLLVEGRDLDNGSVPPRALRGALLKVIDNGVRLVQTVSPSDAALWLHVLARQEARRTGNRGGSGRRAIVVSPTGLLSQIPGIGVESAKELLVRFGSIAGIAGASHEELCTIQDVGPQRARAIVKALTQAS